MSGYYECPVNGCRILRLIEEGDVTMSETLFPLSESDGPDYDDYRNNGYTWACDDADCDACVGWFGDRTEMPDWVEEEEE